MRTLLVVAVAGSCFLLTLVGCSAGSPLVASQVQLAVVANPGGAPNQPAFELTLEAWNDLDSISDATKEGAVTASLDGQALVLDPEKPPYVGDHFRATFVRPPPSTSFPSMSTPRTSSSSVLEVSDTETTWTVEIANLFTNDLRPSGPFVANQPITFEWPSGAMKIQDASIEIDGQTAAWHRYEGAEPGIDFAGQFLFVTAAARTGERYEMWAQRLDYPLASNDGPFVRTRVFARVDGTFE